MTPVVQEWLALAIVACAVAYVARKLWRLMVEGRSGGCASCPASGQSGCSAGQGETSQLVTLQMPRSDFVRPEPSQPPTSQPSTTESLSTLGR